MVKDISEKWSALNERILKSYHGAKSKFTNKEPLIRYLDSLLSKLAITNSGETLIISELFD